MYKRLGLDNQQVQNPPQSGYGGRAHYATADYGVGYGPTVLSPRRAATLPHRLRFYFHTETTLGGAPATPAGSTTLSETPPDQTDANAASIAGGHVSSSAGVPTSQLNPPTSKPDVSVTGEPPLVDLPIGAHQFGWFSELTYTGRFATGTWQLQWREDDNASGVAGHPVLNMFASTARDFTGSMRFLGQLHGNVDWWTGGTAVGTWNSQTTGLLTLRSEYLFCQFWCHEDVLSGGSTLTLHQEGSDLSDAQRSFLMTPQFENGTFVDAPPSPGSPRRNYVAQQLPMIVWYAPGDRDSRFLGLDDPARTYHMRKFKTLPAYFLSRALRGITYDENSVIVPFATVILKRTDTNAVVATTVSDANGNYYFTVPE